MIPQERELLLYLYHRFPAMTPEDATFIENRIAAIVKSAKETKREKAEDNYKPTQEEQQEFDRARNLYKILMSKNGMKGSEAMFAQFRKKHKKWKEYLPLLCIAVTKQSAYRERMKLRGEFVPIAKNFQTWLNQSCWDEEVEETEEIKPTLNLKNYY